MTGNLCAAHLLYGVLGSSIFISP